jgi:DNA repair protein RecO (recombination protein O)
LPPLKPSRRRASGVAATVDEAFVLTTVNVGEADRIVVLLTREHGRIEAAAAGARRLKSRFGPALESLTRVRAAWRATPGRDLGRLDSADLIESSYHVLSDPDWLVALSRVTRLFATVALPGEANPKHFRLLQALLDAAREAVKLAPADQDAARAKLVRYGELWIAKLEGFWPAIEACAGCGQRLSGVRQVGYAADGALCRECGRGIEPSCRVGEEAVALARGILTAAPTAVLGMPASPRALGELGRLTSGLLSYHLEREFKPERTRRR